MNFLAIVTFIFLSHKCCVHSLSQRASSRPESFHFSDNYQHRRNFLHTLVAIPAFGLGLLSENQAVEAKDDIKSTTNTSPVIYKSGKSPIIEGKVRNKDDVSGTRRDPNFLRSLADCKVSQTRTYILINYDISSLVQYILNNYNYSYRINVKIGKARVMATVQSRQRKNACPIVRIFVVRLMNSVHLL